MLYQIPIYIDVISPFLLLLFAYSRGKLAGGRDYIIWYLVIQVLLNGAATILDQGLEWPNLYIYHLNCALSFGVLSAYFSSILHFRNRQRVIFWVSVVFFVFFILNLLVGEGMAAFNSYAYSFSSLILVTYCLLFNLENLLKPATEDIFQLRDFWYVIGLFTYYVSSFLIFVTYRKLTQNNVPGLGILWQAHNLLFLPLCLYLLKGILCKPSQERFSS